MVPVDPEVFAYRAEIVVAGNSFVVAEVYIAAQAVSLFIIGNFFILYPRLGVTVYILLDFFLNTFKIDFFILVF